MRRVYLISFVCSICIGASVFAPGALVQTARADDQFDAFQSRWRAETGRRLQAALDRLITDDRRYFQRTQGDLATQLEVTPSAVNKMIAGKSQLSFANGFTAARYLGVEPHYLLATDMIRAAFGAESASETNSGPGPRPILSRRQIGKFQRRSFRPILDFAMAGLMNPLETTEANDCQFVFSEQAATEK